MVSSGQKRSKPHLLNQDSLEERNCLDVGMKDLTQKERFANPLKDHEANCYEGDFTQQLSQLYTLNIISIIE
mgnify:CR=1